MDFCKFVLLTIAIMFSLAKLTMLYTEKVISTNLTIDTELDSIEMQLGKCSFLFNLVMQAKLFPNE